ncbi:MAG: HEAT repeat domain-containing protein [Verrucomicrobiota bacterium]
MSQWIHGLEYENVNPTEEQRAALLAMGEPAIKKLISLLEERDFALKRNFVAYSRHHADIHKRFIAPRYVVPESVYHAQAATALGEIGPTASRAIPALATVATNKDVLLSLRAKAALMKIRQESVAPLLVMLQETNYTNWGSAAYLAKYLGTNAEPAVPSLVKSLQSTNENVRELAADALGGIAKNPDIVVPALLDCLDDQDAGVRRNAIDSLCKFKSAKEQIVPKLLQCLSDTDNNAWLGAAIGLDKILSKEEKKTLLVPALIKSLNSRIEVIRANAASFLKHIDPDAATKTKQSN